MDGSTVFFVDLFTRLVWDNTDQFLFSASRDKRTFFSTTRQLYRLRDCSTIWNERLSHPNEVSLMLNSAAESRTLVQYH